MPYRIIQAQKARRQLDQDFARQLGAQASALGVEPTGYLREVLIPSCNRAARRLLIGFIVLSAAGLAALAYFELI